MRNKIIIRLFAIFILFLGLTCAMSDFASADDTEEIQILVTHFFDSLKTGDTDGIILSLTDPILDERRELLETNPEYSNQLKGVYDGIQIELGSVNIKKNDTALIAVQIKMSDGMPRKTKLFCKKINGSWKISEELSDY